MTRYTSFITVASAVRTRIFFLHTTVRFKAWVGRNQFRTENEFSQLNIVM